MAHALELQRYSTPEIAQLLNSPAARQIRIDLAACFRMAARLGMEEGICNHFSAMVPGSTELFFVNPFGLAFGEIRASDLIVCDVLGQLVQGERAPEITAFYIHARVHRRLPRARVALHTHMPYATALAMREGEPLRWAGQTALKFHGRTAVDEFNGLALDTDEGDRIAAAVGEADIVFMRNHGVMVLGHSVATAWNDLYYLERACQAQVLAESGGHPLRPVPQALAERTAAQMRAAGDQSAQAHLDSVKRQLLATDSDYLL